MAGARSAVPRAIPAAARRLPGRGFSRSSRAESCRGCNPLHLPRARRSGLSVRAAQVQLLLSSLGRALPLLHREESQPRQRWRDRHAAHMGRLVVRAPAPCLPGPHAPSRPGMRRGRRDEVARALDHRWLRQAEQLLEQQPVPHVPQRPPAKPRRQPFEQTEQMRSVRREAHRCSGVVSGALGSALRSSSSAATAGWLPDSAQCSAVCPRCRHKRQRRSARPTAAAS